jgi:hypothetical protein
MVRSSESSRGECSHRHRRISSHRPSTDCRDSACPSLPFHQAACHGLLKASRDPACSPGFSWLHAQPDFPAEPRVSHHLAYLPCPNLCNLESRKRSATLGTTASTTCVDRHCAAVRLAPPQPALSLAVHIFLPGASESINSPGAIPSNMLDAAVVVRNPRRVQTPSSSVISIVRSAPSAV